MLYHRIEWNADETKGSINEPPNSMEIPNTMGLEAAIDIIFNGVNTKTDVMIRGNNVTSNNIEMILNAWKYQKSQGFGFIQKKVKCNTFIWATMWHKILLLHISKYQCWLEQCF